MANSSILVGKLFGEIRKDNLANIRVIEHLLQSGVDVNVRTTKNNSTPLMVASEGTNTKLIEFLIGAGADINASNKFGRTALMFACQMSPSSVLIMTLLEHGADINSSSNTGLLAKDYLFKNENLSKSEKEKLKREMEYRTSGKSFSNGDYNQMSQIDLKESKNVPAKVEKLDSEVKEQIEEARKRLLDLSLRNSLLNFNFNNSERKNNQIRIVNTDINTLFSALINNRSIPFLALPPLPDEPRDEQTPKFLNVLEQAKQSDEIYLKECEKLEKSDEQNEEKEEKVLRDLKDRVREKLGLPPVKDLVILKSVWARENNINPSYDSAPLDTTNLDIHGIQTLLYPKELQKKLVALKRLIRSDKDEKGTNTCYLAFGCLEWTEDKNSSLKHYAPLLLLKLDEIQLDKRGFGHIRTAGDPVQINLSLREKLKEFNIILPEYDEEDTPETYGNKVQKAVAGNRNWRIRNYITVGRFVFSRLAMYEDLDLENWSCLAQKLKQSPLLTYLFKGRSGIPIEGTYDIDYDKNVQKKAPILVYRADSSQHSAIIDAMTGENLVIKGPPGTGKSQTITNLIANALNADKKVLFVSEKKAALDVVYSRLQKANLGEYCLELHSDKTRIANIRSELELAVERYQRSFTTDTKYVDILENKKYQEDHNTKIQLREYYGLLQKTIGSSEKILFDIIWKTKTLEKYVVDFPESFKQQHIADAESKTVLAFEKQIEKLKKLEDLYHAYVDATRISRKYEYMDLSTVSSNRINRLIQEIRVIYEDFERISEIIDKHIQTYKLKCINSFSDLKKCSEALNLATKILDTKKIEFKLLSDLKAKTNLEKLKKYFDTINEFNSELTSIKEYSEDIEKLKDRLSDFRTILEKTLEFLPAFKSKSDIVSLRKEIDKEVDYWKGNLSPVHEAAKIIYNKEGITVPELLVTQEVLSNLSALNQEFLLFIKNKDLFLLENTPSLLRIKEKLNKINTLREELTKIFELDLYDESDSKLKKNIQILSQSGLFSIFSSEYREAVKYYTYFAKNKKTSTENKVKDLKKLLTYRNEIKEFIDNKNIETLLGCYYAQLETPIQPISELNNFFVELDSIRAQKGEQYTTPWLELFCGNKVETIRSLYQLAKQSNKIDFTPYYTEGKTLLWIEYEKSINSLSSLLKSLQEEIYPCYKNKNYTLSEISSTLNVLYKINGLKEKIDEQSSDIDVFFGSFDKQEKTPVKDYEPTLTIAALIHNSDYFSNPSLILEKNTNHILTKIQKDITDIENNYENLIKRISDVYSSLKVNNAEYLGVTDLSLIQFKHLKTELKFLNNSQNALYNTWAYHDALKSQKKTDAGDMLDFMISSGRELKNLDKIYSYLYFNTLVDLYDDKKWSEYRPNEYSDLVKDIRLLDEELIQESRDFLAEKLTKIPVPFGNNSPKVSEKTELALIRQQTSGHARSIPLRSFLQRAGKAVQALKPCFLMSPISLAQYIKPNTIDFDLLIIDEASQMYIEEALGGIFRAKQLVVVGDEKQLPPTQFFQGQGAQFSFDDMHEVSLLEDGDSILEMCINRGFYTRELLWHYRSKDPSLIAFSNKYFYNDKLKLFPSPVISSEVQGIKRVYLNGIYKTNQNEVEANEIIKHIKQFVRKYPNKSLGVATMNVLQKSLIEQKMDQLIESDEYVRKYVEDWDKKLERFFVKNLENVQGDERDFIFISTVYGPNEQGVVRQNFGPINMNNGYRRLNVLFTRAKYGLTLFTSLKSTDIIVDENSKEGLRTFQNYLAYAETNRLHSGQTTHKQTDSYFEDMVKTILESNGYEVVPQVGVKGFFIDLGVRHPKNKNFYAVGIECDGAPYHSTKSARDRDCIRQKILEDLGWKIYRIWSKDWFYNTSYEIQKLLAYIKDNTRVAPEEEYNRDHLDIDTTEQVEESGLIEEDSIPEHVSDLGYKKDLSRTVELYDTVTFKRTDTDEERTLKIVEGNGDISKGTISVNAALAAALLSRELGEEVEVNDYSIVILKILKA